MMFAESLVRPRVDHRNSVMTIGQIILCSFLIALCAQIRIPLPFTPVPITLQTLFVMLVGGMLGSRNGALCVALYIGESILGLPVLSGGRSDPLALFSPVGGYLIGFVVQAYLTGWVVERQARFGKSLMPLLFCLIVAVELCMGALWLGLFVGLNNAFLMGVVPFIPGELLKVMALTAFFTRS